ncbi:hypothetical protein [Nonomuraea turcica]|uniref:hypothetical protein n=1 Tax=Nonomuraea sp. G32 TaxID=3067274 RepID=UPI00273C4DAB|nr:hypothetical protein [Nonomuraea sp. G32]MDP4508289.1 hypothetical protein [Nonomuraea sp. G32]
MAARGALHVRAAVNLGWLMLSKHARHLPAADLVLYETALGRFDPAMWKDAARELHPEMTADQVRAVVAPSLIAA